MLLVGITINAVLNRVSIEGHALTHNWKPYIIDFDAPSIAISSDHGGYAKMEFGGISFNPILFQNDWPPPVACPISISYTDTDELSAELIFSGIAYLKEFDKEKITYDLFGPEYDEIIADATAYNNTLNNVLTTILTTIPEINSVDTTYSRAVSPNVTHTVSGDTLAIDLASEIAEFYSHLFYIVGDTAYLVDMYLDNGPDWTLTEYKFFDTIKYTYKAPVSSLVCGDYEVFTPYPFGDSLSITAYHTTQANIEAALTNIMTLELSARANFDVPMIAGNFPLMGRRIIIPDTSNVVSLATMIKARILKFDFINDLINVEGEGAISA